MTRHVTITRNVRAAVTSGRVRPHMIVHHRGDQYPVFRERELAEAAGEALVDAGPTDPPVMVQA